MIEDQNNEEIPGENDVARNITPEETSKSLVASFKGFIASLYKFFESTLSFAEEVDKSATVKIIKSEIQFKGFNVWILIFSIIIASIGLNVNSTAVIIGAMLISPLMGPIMGIGLSLGTNDWETLMKSLKSLGITVSVSLVTSTLYFLITPFGEAGDELLGRTSPELRDVFIAIFGGLAGIMANTRNKVTNVIPGVAIATALMPPLCTAGYGIATGNWAFFSGAFYLFLINSTYIALSAFIVIRYLKFPLVHFIDELKERKFRKYILFFSILLIIPSIYTLWNSYQQNNFEKNAQEFVEHYFNKREMHHVEIDYNDGKPIIEISLVGKAKYAYEDYVKELHNFDLNQNVNLSILEDKRIDEVLDRINNQKFEGSQFFENMYTVNLQQIKMLQSQKDSLIGQLNQIKSDTIPFTQISAEINTIFENIEQFEYGVYKVTSFNSEIAEVPTFHVKWKYKSRYNKGKEEKLKNWLTKRLNVEKVRVISF